MQTQPDMVSIVFENLTRREFDPEICTMDCSISIDFYVLCIEDELTPEKVEISSMMTYAPVYSEVWRTYVCTLCLHLVF